MTSDQFAGKPPCLQKLANVMDIQICDKRNVTFLVKVAGTNVNVLYGTGVNMRCMSLACYTKLKDPNFYKIYEAMSVHSTKGYD